MRPMCASLILLAALPAFSQGVFEKRLSPVTAREAQNFTKQTKVALVIGVSKYPEASGFSALNYAASDAKDIAGMLTGLGYTVSTLTDGEATRGAILRSLRQVSASVESNQGTLLFYFSGHGFAIGEKNFLAPVSASDEDLEREGLLVAEVEQIMSASKAQRKLMMLDACRSDSAGGKKGAGGRSFSALQAASGFRILNSTRIGDVSYESADLRHGVFSAFVLQALSGKAAGDDGLVTFHDLAGYVNANMRQWGIVNHKTQVPYEAVGASEATGDFLLAGQLAPERTDPGAQPAATATDSQSVSTQDQLLYTAAVTSRDPDQMDQAAAKISNSILASSLRMSATNIRQLSARQAQASNPATAVKPSTEEMELYFLSMRSTDLKQVEDAAKKMTNPMYAQALQQQAQRLRASGGGSTTPATANLNSPLDARARLQRDNTKTRAELYAKRGNYMQALPLYQQAANAGDEYCMMMVATIYYKGLGTDKNYAEALKWFQKAADLGEPKAMSSLAYMYTFAEGVDQNDARAVQLDRKAAQSGDAEGMLGLGYLYENGRGVAKDRSQAISWYRKSAALGNDTAKQILQKMGVAP